jgi:Zn-dependent M16 (insulinase) family peptidase
MEVIPLKILVQKAHMTHNKVDGYVGYVEFKVDTHKEPYEITLYSKSGKEWMYGLHFLNASGSEKEIYALEEFLDENDEYFDQLVDAAKGALEG